MTESDSSESAVDQSAVPGPGPHAAVIEFTGAYFQRIHAWDTDCDPDPDPDARYGPQMIPVDSIATPPEEDVCDCWGGPVAE